MKHLLLLLAIAIITGCADNITNPVTKETITINNTIIDTVIDSSVIKYLTGKIYNVKILGDRHKTLTIDDSLIDTTGKIILTSIYIGHPTMNAMVKNEVIWNWYVIASMLYDNVDSVWVLRIYDSNIMAYEKDFFMLPYVQR